MKARITGVFVIDYEVSEAAGVLGDRALGLQQAQLDAQMLLKGGADGLALEDWPPSQIRVTNATAELPEASKEAVIDGPTGTEITFED